MDREPIERIKEPIQRIKEPIPTSSVFSAVRPMMAYKVVLLGSANVGKSCLCIRYINDEYRANQTPTIGSAFYSHTVSVGGNPPKRLDIWDTAGQERYRSLAPMYYRGAAIAIVVYDVSSYDSFLAAQRWVHDLKRASRIGRIDNDVVIAFVGNKIDLASSKRGVTTEEGFRFATGEGVHFYETSALSGTNVSDMFEGICRDLPDIDLQNYKNSYNVATGANVIRITNKPDKTDNRFGNCC